MSKKLLLLSFFLFSYFIFGQETDDVFEFTQDKWIIGIEQFSGDLSLAYEYLKNSIPDLIKKELYSSELHILSGDEINYYRDQILKNERIELISLLDAEFKNKDNLLFSTISDENEYETIQINIDNLQKKLLDLEIYNKSKINTAEMLLVEWAGSDEENNFYKSDEYIPEVQSFIHNLDYLISG